MIINFEKYFFLVILFLAFTSTALGQNNVYLTFSANINNENIPLDSVYIKNLTHGSDTTIFTPDTILALTATASIYYKYTKNDFSVFQNFPNPFYENTTINIFLQNYNQVTIKGYDFLGRIVANYQNTLIPGFHKFTFYPESENFYFLSIEVNQKKKVLKMIHIGNSSNRTGRIIYEGIQGNNSLMKSVKSNFIWASGDELRFIGYAKIGNNFEGSDVLEDIPAQDETYTFNINKGIPCQNEPIIIDSRDSNLYHTVQIGNQCWMRENLRYLPSVVGIDSYSEIDPYFYIYGYDGTSVATAKDQTVGGVNIYDIYGVIYNWSAAMNGASTSSSNPSGVQGVCPVGWHLPSDLEWTQLENYLISYGYNYDSTTTSNKIAKAMAATMYWNTSQVAGAIGNNLSANNNSGFTALPGGSYTISGVFSNIGVNSFWWSTTESSSSYVWGRYLTFNYNYLYKYIYNKKLGYYIRCLKD